MGRRSQEDRDAITVEIGYALVSASFVAAAGFGGTVAPALFLDLPGTVERVLTMAGGTIAALAFIARVVHVLWRFPRRTDGHALPQQSTGTSPQPQSSDQPSQPGRTSPDS
ncbi:DUF6332 family protein [Streptomyces sp. NBC_00234]|uniref:DUF6332 family protein n=1 Tax=Streptomyces sp. NBC_00234 TaxID=2903638 RepID=UPI002E2DFC1C|nr:DUF6332 family protein [Streptomyces sp. NBC_00234]